MLAAGLATTACGSIGGTAADGNKPVIGLRVLVPNSPGRGYDTTARNIEVFNVSGASGMVGLHRLVNEKGNGELLIQMGLGLVGAVYTDKSTATLDQTTPIARLIEEPDVIVVPAKSPYQTIGQLLAAWKANPGKLPVGGGPCHDAPAGG